MQTITLEMELDAGPELDAFLARFAEEGWTGVGEQQGISIVLENAEEGLGFGISTAVTIVVSVGLGVASDLVAGAIREATPTVIRRVKASRRRSDGSQEGITELLEEERRALDDA